MPANELELALWGAAGRPGPSAQSTPSAPPRANHDPRLATVDRRKRRSKILRLKHKTSKLQVKKLKIEKKTLKLKNLELQSTLRSDRGFLLGEIQALHDQINSRDETPSIMELSDDSDDEDEDDSTVSSDGMDTDTEQALTPPTGESLAKNQHQPAGPAIAMPEQLQSEKEVFIVMHTEYEDDVAESVLEGVFSSASAANEYADMIYNEFYADGDLDLHDVGRIATSRMLQLPSVPLARRAIICSTGGVKYAINQSTGASATFLVRRETVK